MRVVLFPVYSSKFVPAAPSLNFARAFVSASLAIDPEAVFYLCAPEDGPKTGWSYGEQEIELPPRTHLIKMPMYRSQFDDLHLLPREFWSRFSERFGDLWFDAILNERPAMAPLLRRLSSFHLKSKTRNVTMVTRSQIVTRSESFGVDPMDEILEVTGSLVGTTVYQSPHQRERAIDTARKIVRPTWVQRLMDNSKVLPLGIDCDDVDRINGAERHAKYELPTVNYSAKLFNANRFVQSLAIMDSTFAGGRQVQLQIVTGSSAAKMYMVKKAQPFEYMRTVERATREVFLKEIARAHVFVSNSPWEDFSATICELLYSGLIPVMVDQPWSRYLVPEGYPYLFRDQLEGNGMLRYVVDNWQAVAAEWVEKIQSKIRAEFDLKKIAPEMYRLLADQRAADHAAVRLSPSLIELVDDVWEHLPDEFDLDDMARSIKKLSTSLDVDKEVESRSTPRWLLADALILGHRSELTDLGTLVPRWRKKD